MQAEALIAAMACSVCMGEYEKAKQMLAQVSSLAGLPISTKCKAYREMLLVTKEVLPLEDTACLESTLGDLLQSDGARLETWDVLKSQWALEKCRLLRDPQAALAQVESFAREFCNLERLKDASDVLAFGAELLQNTGATRDAYSLLGRAYALLQGNKTPRAKNPWRSYLLSRHNPLTGDKGILRGDARHNGTPRRWRGSVGCGRESAETSQPVSRGNARTQWQSTRLHSAQCSG